MCRAYEDGLLQVGSLQIHHQDLATFKWVAMLPHASNSTPKEQTQHVCKRKQPTYWQHPPGWQLRKHTCRVVAFAISEMARTGYDYIVSEITFHLAQMTSADVVAKVCCSFVKPGHCSSYYQGCMCQAVWYLMLSVDQDRDGAHGKLGPGQGLHDQGELYWTFLGISGLPDRTHPPGGGGGTSQVFMATMPIGLIDTHSWTPLSCNCSAVGSRAPCLAHTQRHAQSQ